ncbi:MAG: hypothetical protein WCS88_01485 [Patescibacteria group bacterium]|jgi:hypothetical protein
MPKNTKKEANKNENLESEKAENIDDSDYGKVFAAWEFPEFIKHERGKIWYASFTIVFLALLIYAYFSDNLLFAIILVIFAVLYLTSAKNDPLTVETAITEGGIFINNKFIPYEDFANFYIIYYPPEIKNLYLEPKSIIKHTIVIPLEDQNPIHLREILLTYLDEDLEKEEIPANEGISRILKL